MQKELEDGTVERAAARPKKRREIPDGRLPGLYLIIKPTGNKSWALRYRFGRAKRKISLGSYPALGLAGARQEALNKLKIVVGGSDPASAHSGILPASPLDGAGSLNNQPAGDRVLSNDEIRWLWKAADRVKYPFGPFAQMALLTLQRKSEVANASASQMKLAEQLWIIPLEHSKSGRATSIALSDAVLAIRRIPLIESVARPLFTINGRPISGFSGVRNVLHAEMLRAAREDAVERGRDPAEVEIPAWTLHDIRRTGAAAMRRLGVSSRVVEAILNKKTGTLGHAVAHIEISFAEEKKAGLASWGQFVMTLVGDNGTGD